MNTTQLLGIALNGVGVFSAAQARIPENGRFGLMFCGPGLLMSLGSSPALHLAGLVYPFVSFPLFLGGMLVYVNTRPMIKDLFSQNQAEGGTKSE